MNNIYKNRTNLTNQNAEHNTSINDESYKKIAMVIKGIINSAISYSVSKAVKNSKSIEELRKEIHLLSKQLQVYEVISQKAKSIDDFKNLLINSQHPFPDLIKTLKEIYSAIPNTSEFNHKNNSINATQDNSEQISIITEELFDSNALIVELFDKFVKIKEQKEENDSK